MKKYSTIFAMLVAAFVLLAASPRLARAQGTNPFENYRMNDLIRRMPKKSAAARKKAVRKKPVQQNKTRKKIVRRKVRRAL